MKTFFSSIFSSCLGALLALIVIGFLLIAIGTGFMLRNKTDTKLTENSVLQLIIPGLIPEQTNNNPIQSYNLNNTVTIGLKDLTKAILHAAKDPKIRGIYLQSSNYNHGYATLKEIRDALQAFKNEGKFIICYSNYLDHKNYYINSVANQLYLHPLGFLDLKGFGISIPYFKEFTDKIGLDFNIYYAGEFKSATEPFRLNKMSDQNRLQLKEFLGEQYHLYLDDISKARNLDYNELKSNFDGFKSYSPKLAYTNQLIDSIAYESDVLANIRSKMNFNENDKIHFINIQDYFVISKSANEDFSSSNRIAVVYAEGNIIEGKGEEGEIGRKYIKILRDIRSTKSIKAVVLRVNSPGGSALLSDELLKEIDLIKAQGKPVVVSMGDYAASGGYYISCHADSIFSNAYTLTGSIGVFALIPNFNRISGDKIGIDIDTVGTGPMANKFNVMLPWGVDEAKIMQENIAQTYDQFISVISSGRSLAKEQVKEFAKGRIWSGIKAKELGLVNKIGNLDDAISCASRMASLEKFRISEFPTQKDPIQKLMEALQGNNEEGSVGIKARIMEQELEEMIPYYQEMKYWKTNKGLQMKLPFIISK
ncbi:MAG: signal peptide peptidase SppA [Saprospiraceae bacterium]|nr:signal peptide peptidase SppA [Saprospiraceae bacterium]